MDRATRGRFGKLWTHVALCASLVACQAAPVALQTADVHPFASFTVDRQAVLENMAHPPVQDWTYQRLTTAEADRIRHNTPIKPPSFGIQALGYKTSFSTTTNGKLTSSPAYDWKKNRSYALTNDGILLRYQHDASGNPTLIEAQQVTTDALNDDGSPIGGGGVAQTFSHTSITMSFNGKRAYVVSQEGNFIAIDVNTGDTLDSYNIGRNTAFTSTTLNYNIGGTLDFTGPEPTMPAPWIDALASRTDGTLDTVYILGNSGTAGSTNTVKLFRFTIGQDQSITTDETFTLSDSYTLPSIINAGAVHEGVRAAPIVLGGKAVIGTWVQDSTTTTTADFGRVYYYDTKCTTATVGSTTGMGPGNVTAPISLSAPVWATPAVDVDNSFVPYYAFVPVASSIAMIHLPTSQIGQSVSLLVDQQTPPTTYTYSYGKPVVTVTDPIVPPQSLNNYPYNDSTVEKTIYPDNTVGGTGTPCSVTLSDDNATNLRPSYTVNKTNDSFFSFRTYDADTDAEPFKGQYAYVKFTLDAANLTITGEPTPRALISSSVRLHCSVASNSAGAGGYPAFEGWVVKSEKNDGSGVDWDYDTITPNNRPTFFDGDAFDTAGDYSTSPLGNGDHDADKLIPSIVNNGTASTFQSTAGGLEYDWYTTGKIPENETRTFAFYDDLDHESSTSHDNGKPHNAGCPKFTNGGTGENKRPKLILELSSRGAPAPAMCIPVTIDSLYQQIWAVNTNAIYRVSYQTFTAAQYSAASIAESMASLADPTKTFYNMTSIGADAADGPLFAATGSPNTRFVGNRTAPLLTNGGVYVMDNDLDSSGRSIKTTLRKFGFGTIPTTTSDGTFPPVVSTLDITSGAGTVFADAACGTPYMVFEPNEARLYVGTFHPTAASPNNGRLWAFNL